MKLGTNDRNAKCLRCSSSRVTRPIKARSNDNDKDNTSEILKRVSIVRFCFATLASLGISNTGVIKLGINFPQRENRIEITLERGSTQRLVRNFGETRGEIPPIDLLRRIHLYRADARDYVNKQFVPIYFYTRTCAREMTLIRVNTETETIRNRAPRPLLRK